MKSSPEPLSICFFCHSALLGGAQRSLLELVGGLVRRGVRCAVVLPEDGPLAKLLESAGARVLRVPFTWWGQKATPATQLREGLGPSMTALLEEGMPAIESLEPDVIVTNTLVIPWGAVAAALLQKPHVWNVCEFGPLDESLEYVAPREEILEAIRRCSNGVLVPSEAVRRELFGGMPAGFCVNIGRHVEIPPVGTGETPADLYRRPFAGRLGLFATLTEDKGQRIAIDAVAELLARGRDVELLIAGTPTPPFAEDLRRRINKANLEAHVYIAGFLADPYPAMASSDVVLAPFRQDAFARVVLEAMRLGRPVIGSRAGGVPELIQDGFNGFLVPHGDVPALADRIEWILSGPELGEWMGENGWRFAEEAFPEERFVGRALEQFRRVREESSPALPAVLLPFLPVTVPAV